MNTTQTASIASGAANRRLSTRDIVLAAMFAAVMTVISQISLPMPTGVPITIQVFGVALIGVVLGWRIGLFSMLVYILLGAVGLPVFANFHGGFSSLVGLTGGYIWSWPIMTVFCGIEPHFKNQKARLAMRIALAIIGLLIVETIGGLQWAALSSDMGVKAVFLYSIVGFVPKDILITVLAVFVGLTIRKSIVKNI